MSVGALAVWALNDHVLKVLAPGALSGKLSDIASLVAFPLLATAAVELAHPTAAAPRRGVLVPFFALLTAAVMCAINTNYAAAGAYRWGLGAAQWPFRVVIAALLGLPMPHWQPVTLTMDLSDLWTLPAAVVPIWIGRSEHDDADRSACAAASEGRRPLSAT